MLIVYFLHRMKYTYFSRIGQYGIYLAVPLLILTMSGLGTNLNDASRWLRIPIIGLTFQTSDFAKLALILYISRILALKQREIKDFKKGFLPVIIPIVITCAFIFPADLSTAAVVFVSCLMLMFIGRVSLAHIGSLVAVGIIGMVMVLLVAKSYPDVFPRAQTWVNRWENFITEGSKKGNYQVEQAKIAIATGGIKGKGPGNSTQRNFLPHPYSDFIYAIVIEEYGLIGGFSVLMLYLILLYRGIWIVTKTDNSFAAFVVVGLSFSLVFQALINMAVNVNLLPVTGQPLPILSMGGTSILFTCVSLGIILSVSAHVEKKNGKKLNTVSG